MTGCLAGDGGLGRDQRTDGTAQETGNVDGDVGTNSPDRALRITIGSNERGFRHPPVRAVRRGELVELQVTNRATAARGVTIEGYGVSADVGPEAREAVTFRFNAPGIFPITVGDRDRRRGQLFVRPTTETRLPQVTGRRLQLRIRQFAGFTGPSPPTVFALENDDVTFDVANRTDAPTGVSLEAVDVDRTIESGSSARLSFVADEPGIFRIGTVGAVEGQFVVLPSDADFTRLAASGKRVRRVVVEGGGERIRCTPAVTVCKRGEEIRLDVLTGGSTVGGADDPASTARITPTAPGISPYSEYIGGDGIRGQLVVLP